MTNPTSDIPDNPQSLLRKTVIFDTVRACMLDPMHAAFRGSGIAVLVALQFFHGEDWQKGILAAVPCIGMILSPLGVVIASHLQIKVSRLAGTFIMLMAPGLILASLAQNLLWFMIGILISVPIVGIVVPLLTAMWQQKAPGNTRGKAFSRVTLAGSVSAVIASVAISLWLGGEAGRYRPVMIFFAVMSLIAGVALLQIPSRPVEHTEKGYKSGGLHVLGLLWQDKLFGYLCISQMLIGFGNLATIPLRTEFLGSVERGGMGYKAGIVFLITVVIPEIGRLLSIPFWGHLFDRLNFAIMRMSVSSCFVVSLVFTFSPYLWMQIVGAAFFGAGMGGGSIAWSLWVTKLAPAEKTADYMAVHTFLTGSRGIVAPQVAFLALSIWSIQMVGILAAGLVVISILMLAFAIPKFKGKVHD